MYTPFYFLLEELMIGLFAYPVGVLFFPFAWYFNHTSTVSLPKSVCVLLAMQMVCRRMGDFSATSVSPNPRGERMLIVRLLDTFVLDVIPNPEYLALANSLAFSIAVSLIPKSSTALTTRRWEELWAHSWSAISSQSRHMPLRHIRLEDIASGFCLSACVYLVWCLRPSWTRISQISRKTRRRSVTNCYHIRTRK
jgi:hypothetical protein